MGVIFEDDTYCMKEQVNARIMNAVEEIEEDSPTVVGGGGFQCP